MPSPIPVILYSALALGIAVAVLRKYISFRENYKVIYFATLLGYFFSFSIIFLMPVDVAVTSYLSCMKQNDINDANNKTAIDEKCAQPFDYVDPFAMQVIWNLIYWTTYVATWAVYPMMQSYVVSGEFTVGRKIIAGLKENAIWYAAAGAVGVVVFILLWFAMDKENFSIALNVAVITASMWGILLLIMLLGYGLVFVPRHAWYKGNREVELKHAQFQLVEYREAVEDSVFELQKTLKLVKKYDQQLKKTDENRKYIDEIISKCPTEYQNIKRGEGDVTYELSSFVDLHAKVMADTHLYVSAKTLFEETFKEAVALEDTIAARRLGWRQRVRHTLRPARSGIAGSLVDILEWFWSLISPVVWKLLAILFALLSLALVYSEVIIVFPKAAKYSVFALLVHLGASDPLILQIFCLLCIAYIAGCAYTSLFKLKLFSFYQLLPHQRTDANSIIFSAAYLSRLVGVIALNFLHVINLTNTPVSSPFLLVMRSDPIQNWIYQYFPFILVLFCLGTIFNVFNKILGLCNVKSFQFSSDFDDEQIIQGSELMFKEREARARGSTSLKVLDEEERLKQKIVSGPTAKESSLGSSDPDIFDERIDDGAPAESRTPITNKVVGFFSSLSSTLAKKGGAQESAPLAKADDLPEISIPLDDLELPDFDVKPTPLPSKILPAPSVKTPSTSKSKPPLSPVAVSPSTKPSSKNKKPKSALDSDEDDDFLKGATFGADAFK